MLINQGFLLCLEVSVDTGFRILVSFFLSFNTILLTALLLGLHDETLGILLILFKVFLDFTRPNALLSLSVDIVAQFLDRFGCFGL